jgi:hypothetical protein
MLKLGVPVEIKGGDSCQTPSQPVTRNFVRLGGVFSAKAAPARKTSAKNAALRRKALTFRV